MSDLLRAHAYEAHVDVSQIRINAEVKAPDDGCDGWSPKPNASDSWFGSTQTCWQWKAGVSGQPQKLSGEVVKPIPRATLLAGGRFVVVASGSTSGKAGEDDRLEVLRKEAIAAALPTNSIDVIGCEWTCPVSVDSFSTSLLVSGLTSSILHRSAV